MITKEDIKKAKELDLVELVQDLGFNLIKKGNDTYAWDQHDSFRISRHKGFYWHRKGIGGDNIKCIQEMCSCNFLTAMELIQGKNYNYSKQAAENKISEEKKNGEFSLPKKAENGKRAFAYLVKTRGIDPDIVSAEFKKGSIYQEEKTGNAIFVGFDGKTPKSAVKRGVSAKRFAGNEDGSDFTYPFRIGTSNETIYLFESPIDALSYMSMYGKEENASYISLNGVGFKSIEKILHDEKLKTIIVCTDSDEAGERAFERLKKLESENKKDRLILRETPKYKDFNEDLLNLSMERGMQL